MHHLKDDALERWGVCDGIRTRGLTPYHLATQTLERRIATGVGMRDCILQDAWWICRRHSAWHTAVPEIKMNKIEPLTALTSTSIRIFTLHAVISELCSAMQKAGVSYKELPYNCLPWAYALNCKRIAYLYLSPTIHNLSLTINLLVWVFTLTFWLLGLKTCLIVRLSTSIRNSIISRSKGYVIASYA